MNSFLGYYNCFDNIEEEIESNKDEDKSFKDENKKEEEKINENENDESEKPKKKLVSRPGDWICGYCHNLNFAFRIACNRCKMSKFYWY